MTTHFALHPPPDPATPAYSAPPLDGPTAHLVPLLAALGPTARWQWTADVAAHAVARLAPDSDRRAWLKKVLALASDPACASSTRARLRGLLHAALATDYPGPEYYAAYVCSWVLHPLAGDVLAAVIAGTSAAWLATTCAGAAAGRAEVAWQVARAAAYGRVEAAQRATIGEGR